MGNLKSERHHWWPRCVSREWAAQDGTTGWMRPDGTVIRVPPAKLAMIGNGHHIKLAPMGSATPWDSSFEHEYDNADTHFPAVISWLGSLDRHCDFERPLRERFVSQPAADNQLRALTESAVSLAVRSPRNREASVASAERLRGPLPERERNGLIGANMQRSQRLIADSIGANGKFAVLFTGGREFIYGDGFFHNVTAVHNPPQNPKILAPITPTISVIVSRPSRFTVEPRLSTMVLSDAEVELCNHAVQVYSREALFFRTEKPTLHDAFSRREHLKYASPDNPLERLIRSIPGVFSSG
ncbi:MAG: hypothetical protein JWQ07_4075 [Ramlibacter sp.]|nr:hypothetical protein [Ramlibacter sp.]